MSSIKENIANKSFAAKPGVKIGIAQSLYNPKIRNRSLEFPIAFLPPAVIPAKAGIQVFRKGMDSGYPAIAGFRNDNSEKSFIVSSSAPLGPLLPLCPLPSLQQSGPGLVRSYLP